MSGRYHAHVHGYRLGRSDRSHFAFLQHPQQLDLQRERHITDFVQEQRAAVGRLKKPLMRGNRARERAACMPEQLRFEQLRWNRAAIYPDERLFAT